MRKVKNTYTPEKVSVKEYFGIFKGIKIPWLFFVMILVCTIGTTIAGMTLTYFTGDVVDASGEVSTWDFEKSYGVRLSIPNRVAMMKMVERLWLAVLQRTVILQANCLQQ